MNEIRFRSIAGHTSYVCDPEMNLRFYYSSRLIHTCSWVHDPVLRSDVWNYSLMFKTSWIMCSSGHFRGRCSSLGYHLFTYLSLHTYIVLTLNEDHNEVKIVAWSSSFLNLKNEVFSLQPYNRLPTCAQCTPHFTCPLCVGRKLRFTVKKTP